MIDTKKEKPIPLSDAAKSLRSRPVSRATIYRWATGGIRGVRLEVIPVGGSLCTTEDALQRFYERLSEAKRSRPFTTQKRTAKQRERAAKEAGKKLAARGA